MTYDEYIEETTKNCVTVLADCTIHELENLECLKRILWEDDRVTGVMSGLCTSLKGSAAKSIEETLFDDKFLADFNEHGLNMQNIMAYGPDAVDVIIRCLALKYIDIQELAEKEHEKRISKDKDTPRNSFIRV